MSGVDEQGIGEWAASLMRDDMKGRCDRCLRTRATDADEDRYPFGGGEHLCWAEWGSLCVNPPGDLFAHLASLLAERFTEAVTTARVEAWDEAADDVGASGDLYSDIERRIDTPTGRPPIDAAMDACAEHLRARAAALRGERQG